MEGFVLTAKKFAVEGTSWANSMRVMSFLGKSKEGCWYTALMGMRNPLLESVPPKVALDSTCTAQWEAVIAQREEISEAPQPSSWKEMKWERVKALGALPPTTLPWGSSDRSGSFTGHVLSLDRGSGSLTVLVSARIRKRMRIGRRERKMDMMEGVIGRLGMLVRMVFVGGAWEEGHGRRGKGIERVSGREDVRQTVLKALKSVAQGPGERAGGKRRGIVWSDTHSFVHRKRAVEKVFVYLLEWRGLCCAVLCCVLYWVGVSCLCEGPWEGSIWPVGGLCKAESGKLMANIGQCGG